MCLHVCIIATKLDIAIKNTYRRATLDRTQTIHVSVAHAKIEVASCMAGELARLRAAASWSAHAYAVRGHHGGVDGAAAMWKMGSDAKSLRC